MFQTKRCLHRAAPSRVKILHGLFWVRCQSRRDLNDVSEGFFGMPPISVAPPRRRKDLDPRLAAWMPILVRKKAQGRAVARRKIARRRKLRKRVMA